MGYRTCTVRGAYKNAGIGHNRLEISRMHGRFVLLLHIALYLKMKIDHNKIGNPHLSFFSYQGLITSFEIRFALS